MAYGDLDYNQEVRNSGMDLCILIDPLFYSKGPASEATYKTNIQKGWTVKRLWCNLL